MSDDIVIIGAGIAGLAAGCYAQMNGYQVRILEAHTLPGGLCTAWRRQGYTFDGCIHHLAGSGPDSWLYQVWRELGAAQGREFLFPDDLVRVEGPDGQALTVYTDIDRLAEHMHASWPGDRQAIDAYLAAARAFTRVDLLALMAGSPDLWRRMPGALPLLLKWMPVTLEQYAQRFQDPFLRRAFPLVQYGFAGIPMGIHLNFLAGCHRRILGWPKGGSLAFAQAIARRFEALGGAIEYRTPVERVLVQERPGRTPRAAGVHLRDGREFAAERVISAADGHATIYELLGGRFTSPAIDAYYARMPAGQEMNVHVSLGVARDLSAEAHAMALLLPEPVRLAGRDYDRLDVEIYADHTGMAPAGKAAVKVLMAADYDYWQALAADRPRYEAEKRGLAEAVIARLDARFPGLAGQVEVIDVATPLTIERFTGNIHGLQAWGVEKGMLRTMLRGLSRTLPGLDGFHMVGQWADATIGISTVAAMGRRLVRRLCRQDGRRFVATVPDGDE